MHPVLFTSSVLAHLARLLAPVGGPVAAIIALTMLVRLAVHPLTRAAVRGERSRLRLAPKVAEIRRKHSGNVAAMSTELAALHRAEGISPFAGLLPVLVQAPIFIILYAAFRDPHGPLATAHVLGVPLATHAFAGAGLAHSAVFGALFAVLATLAWITSRRAAMLARVNAATSPAGPATSRAGTATIRDRAVIPAGTATTPTGTATIRDRAMTPARAVPSGARAATAWAGAATSGHGPAAADSGQAVALARLGRVLPFALLVSAAVLPLATGIYLATTTAWSAIENAALRRGLPVS